jgi:dihydroxyacetone kinase-like protein
MLRAIESIEKTLEGGGVRPIKDLLSGIGWAIMGVDGGATGPLFGTFFTGMAEAVEGKAGLEASDVAAMFEAGLAAVRKQTKARLGDKTVIDALVPAVEAFRQAAESGADVRGAMATAAEAAEQGAAATNNLVARFGRAKHVGEKSVGHPDPGATSVALLFRGFAEGI